jgi:UDP-N-acetylglucosamine 2-epimerase (non-hydrolysing)
MMNDFKIFNIKPDYLFKINPRNFSLSKLNSIILQNTDKVIDKIKPNLVIVHGDTSTTYSSSLSAFYKKIPIAHIESGLRTYDLNNPFPEEFFRQAVGRIANFHFVPDNESKKNLINEKVNSLKIFITGNTIIDTLKFILLKIKKNKKYFFYLNNKIRKILKFNYLKKNFILITMHRRENFDSGLKSLCLAINTLAKKYSEYKYVLPVHPNPAVKKIFNKYLKKRKNIHLTKPLSYELFLLLLNNSKLILTDSGGIQEEAPSLGKPVLVLRKKTERTKSINNNNSLLIGNKYIDIVKNTERLLNNNSFFLKMSRAKNIYGDGHASERIIKVLKKNII